ncbi:efflux RND transporter periplasmic adaptor subunit [Verrucomicrobiaceae bacterium R5-34]|uniref:Efflux RND transporter periplasmic adaptor subunit n=1 Tax=Oceaniferula flava TaxID=2800421 RepID=A0AAE2VCE7_9BACT|nr:efflux RND transporter periplasmic adaptor subunit [Oceaniferula flavus]MBK1829098.1 efflux RND transporter periplasmic adaptor subunit [Verrucomicrobiaceae bacterium R5-34]MBK1853334.1 efflux RND transporter periplasmic adaptor subunit [Oceaniferula flavus]MBM1134639.1 efflux RND transporter periplasmic adaptor subunit [Oceaniferula flavus]
MKQLIWMTSAAAISLVASCDKKAAQQGAAPPKALVEFVHPEKKEIIDWDEYNGRLEAMESVEVRARVGGMLEEIHFTDGQMVEKGDLLFTIDAKPFAAALAAAEADLAQAESARNLAKTNFERGQKLLSRNAISKEEADIRSGDFTVAEARVQAAKARVETAKLDTDYTKVRAPIGGRISDHYVSTGNLISGGSAQSTLLTRIVSVNPIYCRIDADEASVLKYMRLDQEGKRKSARDHKVQAQLAITGDQGYPREGYVDFVDNSLNPETATLRARTIFENKDGLLVPGMFAKVRLPGSGKFMATLVPEIAIQTQQDFTFLLTVDGNETVKVVPVELGPTYGDMRAINGELPADLRVIVSGITGARPGASVQAIPFEDDQATAGK